MTQRRNYTKRVIEHRDFSGGEFGRKEAWNAPANSFTATNMLVYRTGELGVRPGLRNVSPTGLVAGQVWSLNRDSTANSSVNVVFGQGTNLKTFQPSSTGTGFLTTVGGALTATPTAMVDVVWTGTALYLVTNNSGAYQYTGGAISALTGSPNGNSIALFGDRLVIARSTAPVNNIVYNGLTAGVSDFNSWPAANTIPVGDIATVYKLMTQRGHLALMKQYNGHYILTGQLGVSEALRQAVTNPVAPDPYQGMGKSQDGILWFVDVSGKSAHPVSFDGTTLRVYDHLDLKNAGVSVLSTLSQASNAIGFASDDDHGVLLHGRTDGSGVNQTLLFSNGIWTKHSFGPTFNVAQGTCLPYQYQQTPGDGTTLRSTDTFVLSDGGSGAVAPKFYGWTPRMDRPGSETALNNGSPERAGDDSSAQVTGSVEFPEVHLETGTEMMVREITIDFRSWNTGGSLTNHFDVEIECLRTYNSTTRISLKNSWDEAGSLSSAAGTLKRISFMFGDQGVGNGYQVKFTNCRGIALQRYQVVLETDHYGIRGT